VEILEALAGGPQTATEVSEALGTSRANAYSVLRRMEVEGLVSSTLERRGGRVRRVWTIADRGRLALATKEILKPRRRRDRRYAWRCPLCGKVLVGSGAVYAHKSHHLARLGLERVKLHGLWFWRVGRELLPTGLAFERLALESGIKRAGGEVRSDGSARGAGSSVD